MMERKYIFITSLVLPFLILMPLNQAFAQEADQIIAEIDLDLEERFTPDPPIPADSPFHFIEDIAEAFELAVAPPEERGLIKLKHAEKRILEMERAILEGKPEVVRDLGEKYQNEIAQARIESTDPSNEAETDEDRVREARIRVKIQEVLNEHEGYFAQERALIILEAVRETHIANDVPVAGIEQAIQSVSSSVKEEIEIEEELIEQDNAERLEEIELEIEARVDPDTGLDTLVSRSIIEDAQAEIEIIQDIEITSDGIMFEGMLVEDKVITDEKVEEVIQKVEVEEIESSVTAIRDLEEKLEEPTRNSQELVEQELLQRAVSLRLI